MSGKLYGVGVGPGDKRLLTVLAVEVLKSVDKIVAPDSGGEQAALKVVSDYVEGKELLMVNMPMTRERGALFLSHKTAAQAIANELSKGLNLAFITLGDPTVYSTYMYIHRLVEGMGYECEIVNGVPSFCAAAARLNMSLCDRDEPLHIIPASYSGTDELLKLPGNKVLMKSGKHIGGVIDRLRELGQLQNAKMAECCCMENERLYECLSDVKTSGYFSLIIVKGQGGE